MQAKCEELFDMLFKDCGLDEKAPFAYKFKPWPSCFPAPSHVKPFEPIGGRFKTSFALPLFSSFAVARGTKSEGGRVPSGARG